MNWIKTIQNLSTTYLNEIIEIRRHLHQYPELSFKEEKTARFIAEKLKKYFIPFQTGIAGNGVIGVIKCKKPESKTIILRADIDALPISEKSQYPFPSRNENIMHACGHDMHTSSLLGTGKIIHELKEKIEGTVVLLFQPAEEKLPGGAISVMNSGILDKYKPSLIIGQHIDPELPIDSVGFRKGIYMASSDEVYITVKGKGGHAALRKEIKDPIIAASEIIIRLQEINKQNTTEIPLIISIGKVIADGATNVVPDIVKLEGTMRTFNEGLRLETHKKIRQLCRQIANDNGCEADANIVKGYPVLKNSTEETDLSILAAKEYLGKNVHNLDLRMTAEDFAYYSQKYPAVFYRFGTKNKENNKAYKLHSPDFYAEDKALRTGIGFLSYLAIKHLIY